MPPVPNARRVGMLDNRYHDPAPPVELAPGAREVMVTREEETEDREEDSEEDLEEDQEEEPKKEQEKPRKRPNVAAAMGPRADGAGQCPHLRWCNLHTRGTYSFGRGGCAQCPGGYATWT